MSVAFVEDRVPLDRLKPHPRNYQYHPNEQIQHLAASLTEYGVYRRIITARDDTILAGHGLVQALRANGDDAADVRRYDLDPDDPRALKLLAVDNEVSHLSERDDRALSELLKEVDHSDLTTLFGTGYDEMMLANLLMVTRPASEIQNMDAASQWVGLPGSEGEPEPLKVVVSFRDEPALDDFLDHLGLDRDTARLTVHASRADGRVTRSMNWPPRDDDDLSSIKLVTGAEE